MNFEQNNNLPESSHSQPDKTSTQLLDTKSTEKTLKKRSCWEVLWQIIIGLSVLANIGLLLVIISIIILFTTGRSGILAQEIIKDGPRTSKIAIITVQGMLNGRKAKNVYRELNLVWQDKRIKGLIICINTPGGSVSASDGIYHEIQKYREQTGKPVVAFMQGTATSGGYYLSTACNKIIAEPTAITGSIGVVMNYFVFQKLLEDKLGILPVVIKHGKKKDWPSPFRLPTEEQLQYIRDRLLTPPFKRFMQVIAKGRPSLTLNDIESLADGSIYTAQEAFDKDLIDKVGYFDDAIELVLSLAGIEKARVIKYRKSLSLFDLFNSFYQNIPKIDIGELHEIVSPQISYL